MILKEPVLLACLVLACSVIWFGSWVALAQGFVGVTIGGFVTIIVICIMTIYLLAEKTRERLKQ